MKEYILIVGDGDGCTYHEYTPYPFITDNIDKWEFELLSLFKSDKYYEVYNGIEIPIGSKEFSYEILTLNDWFYKNLKKHI